MDLVALYDGTVAQVNIAPGDLAIPNQAVIVVADLSNWTVETNDLTEKDVVAIATGEKASIVPDALPGYNDRGERLAENHHVLPRQYASGADPSSLFDATLGLAAPVSGVTR